jgi:hypothetical protein
MTHIEQRSEQQELHPLTDSLSSRVRWRVSDYAAIFRAQIDLMLAAESANARRRRASPKADASTR